MNRELLLRAHIQQLLLPYVLKHLTTNYVAYSESEALRLLSESLDVVPLQDPTFLALSVDPFDLFNSLFRIKEQLPFVESWKVDTETKTFMLNALGSSSASTAEGPATRCFCFEEDLDLPPEFMSTVLSRRAVRETPELGKLATNHTEIISTPLMLLKAMPTKSVPEEYIQPAVFSVKDRDFLLGVRYSIDKEMSDGVMNLIKHTAGAAPVDARHNGNSLSRAFLRNDSPPYQCREHMSPPVFPMNCRVETSEPVKPSDIQSLGFVRKVELSNDEEEVSKKHMQVINGWTVVSPDFSDTPSLANSSQTTEFDELFALTPPRTTVNPKMDEYLIPRVLRPGEDSAKETKNDTRNLSEFLTPLLSQMETVPSSDSVEPRSPHPEIPSSVLGQPSRSRVTNMDDMGQSEHAAHIQSTKKTPKRLRTLVETVCAPVHDESPEDWILSERLEEKEALMMEVPKMREPCVHPPSPSCPNSPNVPISLICTSINAGSVTNTSIPLLKKVSGSQSLNIELSWRPFNFGSRIPTTEELSNTESFVPVNASEVDTLSEECIKNAFSLLETPKSKDVSEDHMEFDDNAPMRLTSTFGGDYDIVLTNADRRKIYPEQSQATADDIIPEYPIVDEDGEEKSENPIRTGMSNKRPRIAPSSGVNNFRFEVESTHLGQDLATIDIPWPHLLSPDLGSMCRSPSRSYGEHSSPECSEAQPGLRGSSHVQQGKETVSKDLTSTTETFLGYISSGAKSAIVNQKQSFSNDLKPSSKPEGVTPVRQAFIDFLQLHARGKFKLDEPKPPPIPSPPLSLPSEKELIDRPSSPSRGVPLEIVDANTIGLPPSWPYPATRLKYIASMNVLQKTVLLEHLESQCCIDLVERENIETHGADLIIDLNTALLYVPLSSLHLSKEKLAERIAVLSWRFTFIIIVFEAYSIHTALRPLRLTEGNLTPYAFPSVTVKAIKTLKKLLTVMEMMPSTTDEKKTAKLSSTLVKYAYAHDVSEAAKFARLVGDEISVSDTEWLSDEYTQDEKDLSCIPGMNIYAAALLLRHIDHDVAAFVNMTSTERLGKFSNILGEKRVLSLNDEIETRLAMVLASSSPSSPTAPFVEDHRTELDASYLETESVELLSE